MSSSHLNPCLLWRPRNVIIALANIEIIDYCELDISSYVELVSSSIRLTQLYIFTYM